MATIHNDANDTRLGETGIVYLWNRVKQWVSGKLPTAMTGASESSDGTEGLVPAPKKADAGMFLKGDGTWAKPEMKVYTEGDGIDISADDKVSVDFDLVAKKSDLPEKVSALENDAEYITISDVLFDWTVGGSGTAGDKFSVKSMTGATTEADGVGGIVPPPSKDDSGLFLKGDGTWAKPTDTTYTNGTGLTLDGTTFAVDSTKYYDRTEIDAKLNAHAVFCTDLPETGDPSKVYYVGPVEGKADAYDVYVWKVEGESGEFIKVDESSISLDGYWHGNVKVSGEGEIVTSVEVDTAGEVTVTKMETAELEIGDGLSMDGTTLSIDASVVAKKSSIPTKVSTLENDSEFITLDDVPEYTAGSHISIDGRKISVDPVEYKTVDTSELSGDAECTIPALNTYYDLGQLPAGVAKLTVSIPEAGDGFISESAFQFEVSDTAMAELVIDCGDNTVRKSGDFTKFAVGKLYQVTVVNHCAVIGVFE